MGCRRPPISERKRFRLSGMAMISSIFGLGFLIGMQHALEADHMAAVSSIASRQTGLPGMTRHGAFWGIGHALTLFLVAGSAICLSWVVTERWSSALELCVGLMLVGLGANVLWRMWRTRVHFHAHNHRGGKLHFHAHSHREDQDPHKISAHAHEHPEGLPWRTLFIGLMHGMAGSAALIVLTAVAMESPLWGLAYIFLFGLGSIAGMALLSMVIAIPLSYTAHRLTWVNRTLQAGIGSVTMLLGFDLIHESALALKIFS